MNERARDTANPPPDALAFAAALGIGAGAADGDGVRRLEGVAYSGDVIAPHSYWGAVIFDLSTLTLPERVPVLVDHDRAQRAGWASLAVRGGALEIAEGRLLANATGAAVAADADQGFPWQMSVHIDPATIEEIAKGAIVVVNGRTVTGPAYVFRNSRIREVTVTPTGADHRTSAQVFSAAPVIPTESPTMSNPNPAATVESLQAQLDALSAKFSTTAAALEQANARLAEYAAAERAGQVRDLFSATGMAFSDEAAAPFLAMDATTFSATDKSLRASVKPAPKGNPPPAHLFAETATSGADGDAPVNPHDLAEEIRQFQATRAAEGRPVTAAQAAQALRQKRAQASA
jgi:hypothetical protein